MQDLPDPSEVENEVTGRLLMRLTGVYLGIYTTGAVTAVDNMFIRYSVMTVMAFAVGALADPLIKTLAAIYRIEKEAQR